MHRLRGHGKPLRLELHYLVCIAFIFGWLVQFWWWEFKWTTLGSDIDFRLYSFLVPHAVSLFMIAVILVMGLVLVAWSNAHSATAGRSRRMVAHRTDLDRHMQRGAMTRGRYARLMEGAEAIEIKATIPHKQVAAALKHYKLTRSNDEQRFIYFFDSPKLELLEAGIVLRARRVVGDEHDSTVKFRPVDPARVGKRWRRFRDFKIEADASEKGVVKSASFSMPVAKGLIKRVVSGEKGIASLFTEEQEAFLADLAGGRRMDFTRLAVLGPLEAQRWDFDDPACPWPITGELWRRADGATLMEVSVKAPAVQAAAVMAGFIAFLAEVGAERDVAQQAKTRWALDYYAAQLGKRRIARRR